MFHHAKTINRVCIAYAGDPQVGVQQENRLDILVTRRGAGIPVVGIVYDFHLLFEREDTKIQQRWVRNPSESGATCRGLSGLHLMGCQLDAGHTCTVGVSRQ